VPGRLSLCPEGGRSSQQKQHTGRLEKRQKVLPACEQFSHQGWILLQRTVVYLTLS